MTIDEGFRALARRLDVVAQLLREILAEMRANNARESLTGTRAPRQTDENV